MTLSECDECHAQAEIAYYPQFGAKWLCPYCYERYDREYGEPHPDELMEDSRAC